MFVLVVAIVLAVVPFTRHLVIGLIRDEPLGEDLRPLSTQIERLSDPDPAVVDSALHEIDVFGDKGTDAIPALIALARDPDRGSKLSGRVQFLTARESAIRVIGDMGAAAEVAVPDIIPFLFHEANFTRIIAAEALQKIGPAAVADTAPLIRALRDPTDLGLGSVRRPIAKLLREFAPETLKGEISRLLNSDAPAEVRGDACVWAGDFGHSGRDLLPALRKARTDPNSSVRDRADFAISRIDPLSQESKP